MRDRRIIRGSGIGWTAKFQSRTEAATQQVTDRLVFVAERQINCARLAETGSNAGEQAAANPHSSSRVLPKYPIAGPRHTHAENQTVTDQTTHKRTSRELSSSAGRAAGVESRGMRGNSRENQSETHQTGVEFSEQASRIGTHRSPATRASSASSSAAWYSFRSCQTTARTRVTRAQKSKPPRMRRWKSLAWDGGALGVLRESRSVRCAPARRFTAATEQSMKHKQDTQQCNGSPTRFC